jgi:hypothetical protein
MQTDEINSFKFVKTAERNKNKWSNSIETGSDFTPKRTSQVDA